MADESGMYEGKVKGSPVKLQIAENGLLVFDKNGHGIIWEYKALLGWDATRKGVELDTVDGTTVRIVCSNQMVICALMTERALAMAGSVPGPSRDRGFSERSLKLTGPLPTYLHAVSVEWSECFPTLLNPWLAETTSLPQVGCAARSDSRRTGGSSGGGGRARGGSARDPD